MDDLGDTYLALLKTVLTRHGLAGDWRYEPVGRSGIKRWLQGLAGQLGLTIVRRVPIDPRESQDGTAWPEHAETMIGLQRLDQLQLAIDDVLANNVPGDFIETGVWRGGACIFMRGVLMARGVRDRTVWVADSFEGLPKPSDAYPDYIEDGMAFWKVPVLAVSEEQVRENFSRYGLLDDQVRFLQGWFHDTLGSAPIEQLAILRLDGDMYESTIEALDALYEKVASGGYVIVDDYRTVKGAHDAVDDFRRDHGITAQLIDVDYASVYWQLP